MKRRITQIGRPVDCYHCGQTVEYPDPHFDDIPGVGKDPEAFCSKTCGDLSARNHEGQNRPTGDGKLPHVAGNPSVAASLRWAREAESRKRSAANALLKDAIANAIKK